MTRPAVLAVAILCAFALMIGAANAKPRHHKHTMPRQAITESLGCISDNDGHKICRGAIHPTSGHARVMAAYDGSTVIGGRPTGCPHAYCGCGAMQYLGLTDKRLWKAWNWARLFPRASPGPGMAVVWKHHIALIESMTGPREALLRDYNSGSGLSRLHVRSIAGAVVVNPQSRVARLPLLSAVR